MDEKKQQTQDPKIVISDLDKDRKTAGTDPGQVTGGAGTQQQTFNPGAVHGPVKEETVGLLFK